MPAMHEAEFARALPGESMIMPRHKINKSDVMKRLWAKVDASGNCWIWKGCTSRGYGRIRLLGKNKLVHRLTYEEAYGPIADGLVVDHICRNRACARPEHLRAVTQQVNILVGIGACAMNARKTSCKRGHAFTPENTRLIPNGRMCLACERARAQERIVGGMIARTCCDCLEIKPMGDFHKKPAGVAGRSPYCKPCKNLRDLSRMRERLGPPKKRGPIKGSMQMRLVKREVQDAELEGLSLDQRVRLLLSEGNQNQSQIARRLGIHSSMVSRVKFQGTGEGFE